MKKIADALLAKMNLKIVRRSNYEKLIQNASNFRDYELLSLINSKHVSKTLEYLPVSKSQLRQDLFVLSECDFKKGGFFVEFGATNGVDLSNTHLLETRFGWNGILAEPARLWHDDLLKNRRALIEMDCVWSMSGKSLLFNQVIDEDHSGELSTIAAFVNSDGHGKSRITDSEQYLVNTISLNDLLIKHNAPKYIDYLSIDTEGSEYEILKAFDFESYKFKIITCEHNYTPMREKIYDLLISNGYERKHSQFSQFDDWYVLKH